VFLAFLLDVRINRGRKTFCVSDNSCTQCQKKLHASLLNQLSGSERRQEGERRICGGKWNERRCEALRAKESFPSPAYPLVAVRTPMNSQGSLNLCVSIGGMDNLRHISSATLAQGKVISSRDHRGPRYPCDSFTPDFHRAIECD
jgi:hypothetical protein